MKVQYVVDAFDFAHFTFDGCVYPRAIDQDIDRKLSIFTEVEEFAGRIFPDEVSGHTDHRTWVSPFYFISDTAQLFFVFAHEYEVEAPASQFFAIASPNPDEAPL